MILDSPRKVFQLVFNLNHHESLFKTGICSKLVLTLVLARKRFTALPAGLPCYVNYVSRIFTPYARR